jgi:endonuclease/exonuclease/phosphatase family metal-dependent hydrolase
MKPRSKYKILVGTYNCGQLPPTSIANLGNWLGFVNHDTIDIYVFSLQELTTVDNTSEKPKQPDLTNFKLWNDGLLRYINDNRKTDKVEPIWDGRLGGTMLTSFCTKPIRNNINNIKTREVECGRSKTTIKGGICLRFTVGDHSLSFASVHLTADQEADNTEARIEDFHKIDNSNFDSGRFSDQDFVCIMGDLNFRVNLDRQEIVKLSEQKNFEKIIQHDQLTIAKNGGKAFKDYTEGQVNFPPTYKYGKGTNQFNLSEPLHKRSPAYTDRVLYKNSKKVHLKLEHYGMGALVDSDHRPVTAIFDFF